MSGTTMVSESSADRVQAASRGRNAGVIVHANIEGESEFAAENRALAVHLIERQFPVQIVPLSGQLRLHSPSLRTLGRHLKELQQDRLDLAESVLYQSGAPTSWNLDFYGRCRVGRAAFGTDRIPDGWAERCNSVDEIWVPSEFHRETFAASGVERSKIRVIPYAVDSEVFCPRQPAPQLPSMLTKSFRFLAVADGWLASGIDILVRAVVEEFSLDEDVALVIHCPGKRGDDSFVDFEAEVIAFVESTLGRKLEDIPTIALLLGTLSDADRAGLSSACHAFVQPARAEATGRHGLEALACQLPVIATKWGPLDDFLNEQNSFPLATSGLVPAQPEEEEVFAGHRWADPSVDHLRGRMRAEQGRLGVIKRFEWNVVLPEWVQNFCRLLD